MTTYGLSSVSSFSAPELLDKPLEDLLKRAKDVADELLKFIKDPSKFFEELLKKFPQIHIDTRDIKYFVEAVEKLQKIVSDLIAGIKNGLGDPIKDLSRSIRGLGDDIRTAAETLYYLTENVNYFLSKQQDYFWSGVKVTLDQLDVMIKEFSESLPFSHKHEPRVYSFRFLKSQIIHTVVPDGGPVMIYGYKLWSDEKRPPDVRLTIGNESKPLQPMRGLNDNEIVVDISGDTIKANAGKILWMEIIPYIDDARQDTRRLPIFVPDECGMELQLIGRLHYHPSSDVNQWSNENSSEWKRWSVKDSSFEIQFEIEIHAKHHNHKEFVDATMQFDIQERDTSGRIKTIFSSRMEMVIQNGPKANYLNRLYVQGGYKIEASFMAGSRQHGAGHAITSVYVQVTK